MLVPPNLPFFIGNDICRVARIRQILQGKLGPRFIGRILRPEERRQEKTARILRCVIPHEKRTTRQDRDPVEFTRAVEFLAGRFAAKEAVIKAHPYKRLTFQRIAIMRMMSNNNINNNNDDNNESERERGGPLVAVIRDECEAGSEAESYASVSISHEDEYATAVCVAVNPNPNPIKGWEGRGMRKGGEGMNE
ncbi:hypothetical protein F5Y17DRAFT_454070 [Xylariaceae sp. FL0594]|nr:hypothetical protein F5Y17DRAFT_454070 [Xylariaceae sp. FL0594]